MELTLQRAYYSNGTNGTLFYKNKLLCFTIELPWKENQRNISCIPEGIYEVVPRYTPKRGNHLLVMNVVSRSFILFHAGNKALQDLRGCIAPVTYLNGIGKGLYSRDAMQKLVSLVNQAKERKETILLTIKSENYEFSRTL